MEEMNASLTASNKISLRSAALMAGIGLLIMVMAAPFAELYVYPKLVVRDNAAATVQNILAKKNLFVAAIFGYLITFICDVIVAWALYILLKPVNQYLSLLTAGFRLVYTVIALVALLHLVTVLRLLTDANYSNLFPSNQLQTQVMFSLRSFKSDWNFGLILFGIHLVLLGNLVLQSKYIPRILGALLAITGFGYLLTTLRPFLFPNTNIDFARYTFYGELVFMLWLLIKGSRIRETDAIS